MLYFNIYVYMWKCIRHHIWKTDSRARSWCRGMFLEKYGRWLLDHIQYPISWSPFTALQFKGMMQTKIRLNDFLFLLPKFYITIQSNSCFYSKYLFYHFKRDKNKQKKTLVGLFLLRKVRLNTQIVRKFHKRKQFKHVLKDTTVQPVIRNKFNNTDWFKSSYEFHLHWP